jgi:hypothetical protein
MQNDEAKITLVDIEELRKLLGAEADLADASSDDASLMAPSTRMCPSHPWDQD